MGKRIRRIVSISLDPEIYESVKKAADESRISVSRYIEKVLAYEYKPEKSSKEQAVDLQRFFKEIGNKGVVEWFDEKFLDAFGRIMADQNDVASPGHDEETKKGKDIASEE